MVDWRRRERRRERPSGDSWFYWSQGSHKHFLYLCRYKKLEFTWQLRGYRIVWRVIQSNFWIYSGHKKKKMQLAMCIQCLDILNIKGLEAEAQSRKKQKSVRSGRRQFSSAIWVQKLQQPLINVCCFFLFPSWGWSSQGASAMLKPSSVTENHFTQFCHTSERNQLGWCEIFKIIYKTKKVCVGVLKGRGRLINNSLIA